MTMNHPTFRDPFNGGVNYHCNHCGSVFTKKYDSPMVESGFDNSHPEVVAAEDDWNSKHGFNCDQYGSWDD
jgi:hypothetical protein